MLNRKYMVPGAAIALCAGAAIVHACGPFFPLQLLDNRAGTLAGTPNNSFAYEASHLVTPDDRLVSLEAVRVKPGQQPPDPAKAVLAGLSPAQVATLTQMSKAADGDAAYALGAGLPEAQRLYAAADVDYQSALANCASADSAASDTAPSGGNTNASPAAASGVSASGAAAAGLPASSGVAVAAAASATATAATTAVANATTASTATATSTNVSSASHRTACTDDALFDRAATRLNAILALPGASGAPRAVAAAIELAGITQTRADECSGGATCASLRAAVPAAYTRARKLAAAGAPDPQGLAVASFGDEALSYLVDRKTGKQCDYRSFLNSTPCADAIAPADLKKAIALYAQQTARGSDNGLQSLRFIAGWAVGDKNHVASLIDDPLAQRLLVAYALAREGDIVNDRPESAFEYYGGYDNSYGPTGFADAARGDKGIKPNPALLALVEAIQQSGIEHVAGADRLAALAYRVGRYDFASALVARDPSALASWVSAKLALRRGDTAAAVAAYAQAAKGFPLADSSVEPGSAQLIKGEQAVLTLSRGQYVEALSYMFDAASRQDHVTEYDDPPRDVGFDSDMAYIAERVLTTDELKNFVDAHVPASPVPPLPPAGATGSAYPSYHPSTGDALRYLLARRLVRDGRVDEAVPYFPADNDPRYGSVNWKDGKPSLELTAHRSLARDYAAALDEAQHGWTRTTRARGWFAAAELAKDSGMELMGYEQTPDNFDVDGSFTSASGRSGVVHAHVGEDSSADAANAPAVPDTPEARAEVELAGPFVTADEKRRYAASESKPPVRFHYREIAADYITRAADDLPPRSQAFAAVLCRGTEWMWVYDPDRASAFYRRYVKEGAYVKLGDPFGSVCSEPDFRAARMFVYKQSWHQVKRAVRQHRKWGVLIGLIVAAGVAGFAGWRYRKTKTT
jgi:cellulose synthase operon protein C